MDLLTIDPQTVRLDKQTSSTLVLHMGVPQGCMSSPFPYILFTHDSLAVHPANTVINFAEDTTVNCLRTNDNWLPGALQSNPQQQRGKTMRTLTQEEKQNLALSLLMTKK